jgi:DNA-directed RNA polymerase specialized sigma24 family protein
MESGRTTVAIQHYLDELARLPGDAPAEPVVRQLLERSAGRLHLIGARLLYRSYPRLTRGPLNFDAHEMLSAVVERLMRAMREIRPGTVRQFFALANRHMRWELNDLARRLDEQSRAVLLRESFAAAPGGGASDVSDAGGISAEPPGGVTLGRILAAIEELPEEDQEVFHLIRLQGLTHAEAAEVVGVSAKTIQRRLHRGVIRLGELLADLRPDATPPDGPGGDA